MVGDHIDNDIAPAKALGMAAIQFPQRPPSAPAGRGVAGRRAGSRSDRRASSFEAAYRRTRWTDAQHAGGSHVGTLRESRQATTAVAADDPVAQGSLQYEVRKSRPERA